ncbi:hypothetical protein TWF106_000981 [Orbilia oligospora]|uniref:Uncharacterized protein n=1 Tax=Orbilia oligospora TaxID=2813651 RepID=A0A7C8UIU1_ORBOL|nr:hypothetical protein TWF106_000981 [Orbilia oligospora]
MSLLSAFVALISAQIKSAAVASQRVKMILPVGGFGGSPYLRRRVQEWVDKEKYTIEVAQPLDANYHDEYDKILRVRDQMEWFIKKGVQINGIKSVFRVTYCQHLETEEFADPGDLKITDTLYAYNGDDTPAKPSDYGEIYIHRLQEI